MSEQTPEQAPDETLDAEPSMEDILASIRKIIADDGDPVPLDGPSAIEIVPAPDLTEADPFVEALASPEPVEALDPDTLDLDALLDGVDLAEPELPAMQPLEADALADTISASMDEDLIDLDIPLIPDEPVTTPTETGAVDGNLDALMDDLLVELGEDDAGDLGASAAVERELPEMETTEDMELVKSLMDDLTDEDVAPTSDVDDVDVSVASEIEVPAASEEDDILDSILDMTLDDAIAEQPIDIPEPEPEIVHEAEAADDLSVDLEDTHADEDIHAEEDILVDVAEAAPSLADIAASAEADAGSTTSGAAAAAVIGSVGAGPALVASQSGEAPEVETTDTVSEVAAVMSEPETVDPDLINPETPTPDPQMMETPMPRAVRSDAILDEVTETATTSAFAELNQVVEEKAVFNERGPRIGDLVQEALKPMLKEWLDANLKGIVERAVAKEVKRISSGK
ncbi:MAG: DUF2497 domain-containing protein [Pseudomonadota bacterium]